MIAGCAPTPNRNRSLRKALLARDRYLKVLTSRDNIDKQLYIAIDELTGNVGMYRHNALPKDSTVLQILDERFLAGMWYRAWKRKCGFQIEP